MDSSLFTIITIVLAIVALVLYFKYFKLYHLKNINFIDGSLGTGKTFFSVSLAVRTYRKNLRHYKVKLWCLKQLSKLKKFPKFKASYEELLNEEPILYTNIALDSEKVPHTLLTLDLLQRKNYRFTYKSVLLIDEFSLVADQMQYKDEEINERLSEFFKLFRHETKGGIAILNSQTCNDLHYSVKYVMSDYLYINRKINLGLFSILRVQEMYYVADKNGNQQITMLQDGDITDRMKNLIVLNKYFRYYDTYGYSVFTDGLPAYKLPSETRRKKKNGLKTRNLVSFKKFKYLYENLEKEKESNEHKK